MSIQRRISRRAALAAAAGAFVSAGIARAQNPPLGAVPGAAEDRGPDLVPGPDCVRPTPGVTEPVSFTPFSLRRALLRDAVTDQLPLRLSGLVLTADCQRVPGAVVDLAHADETGAYDPMGIRHRGHQYTDASGAYRFETIRSGPYSGRTAHIHARVQGPGTVLLTTAIYYPDLTELNAADPSFRSDLTMKLARTADGWEGRFDFVLPLVGVGV